MVERGERGGKFLFLANATAYRNDAVLFGSQL